MKTLCYFLLFLFLGINCYSQETEKLPEQPWMELVEMNNNINFPINKWGTDINIDLQGNYTKEDSLSIAKTIKKLDSLTETITIRFSKPDKANLKIKFLENFVTDLTSRDHLTDWRLTHEGNLLTKYKSGIIYIYAIDRKNIKIENFFESKIARVLLGGKFAYPESDKKRESIFNPQKALNSTNKPLNYDDKIIIKEVYRKGFEGRLERAEKKFKKTVLNKLDDDKISFRYQNLWWVKNPISVLILPTLVLALMFGFFILRINKILVPKIKKGWLQFGVITLITLFFADVLIVFVVSLYDFLTIPDTNENGVFVRFDTVITTTITLFILVYPFLFLLRLIEMKISKSSQQIFIKTILVFISTGFLPFVILSLFVYFISSDKNIINENYYILSKAFIILMLIASIRAIISYFILKERSLIIDNEKKLSNLRELNAKAELKSLQSQINPHFLYNSLNSIASLAPIDSKRTQEMAHSLSDLFKYSINRKGKKMSTIKDEIDMVNTYLGIEKIRFGDRLKFVVEVDKVIENHEIPLFLIQPLIENAVKHGISKQAGNGEIRLKIKEEKNELIITVSDSGPNFPKGLVSGHGLQTVYDLLRLGYGDKASLNWTNLPEKTITITMPKKQ